MAHARRAPPHVGLRGVGCTRKRPQSPSIEAETSYAKQLIEQLRHESALSRLKSITVDPLADFGVRLDALKSHGYACIFDLVGVPSWKLSGIPGISSASAIRVERAVSEILNSAEEISSVRFDFEHKGNLETQLLKQLIKCELIERLSKDIDGLRLAAVPMSTTAHGLKTTPGYIGSLIMFENDANRLSTRVAEFEADLIILEEKYKETRAELIRSQGLTGKEAWSLFEEGAARFYTEIERLGGGGLLSTGGLPETLVDKISNFKLDGSLMLSGLRLYQRFAAQYMLAQKKTLIGDEMGLGKTVEAISALAHLAAQGDSHFIVICPLSVLVNWMREIPRHSRLEAISIYGPDRDRMFNRWCKIGGVAVMTYETVSRLDWSHVQDVAMLVVDEAHYIKNPTTKRTQAVVRKAMATSRRIALLTGTPLENRVEEMNTLISYLDPSLRRRLSLNTWNPIAYRQEIAPVYLRRKRIDVLDELPNRIDENDWCVMTKADLEGYKSSLRQGHFATMRRVGWGHSDLSQSSKAARLIEICEEAKLEGSKVLVFSYFLDTLEKVAELVGEECVGIINGKVPAKMRQGIIDEFSRSDKTVLVSQVTAGGVGLNIQTASVVIFCEPQIKPSIEEQAISRSYRMGQVRTVIVHRLLMDKTVDERIEEILYEKRATFDAYADKSQAGMESLGALDKATIMEIIESERIRYGIAGDSPVVDDGDSSVNYEAADEDAISNPIESTSGSANIRRATPSKEHSKPRERKMFRFSLAGIKALGSGDIWKSEVEPIVTVVRDRKNVVDWTTVVLHVGGIKAGYVPLKMVAEIADLLDRGYEPKISSVKVQDKPSMRLFVDERDEVHYEEDWSNTSVTVEVRMTLTAPEYA